MATTLYIDCEFNSFGGELISLALVPADPNIPAFYEVIDLGVNCDCDKFNEGLKQGAQVIACSSLLTTTMPYMKVVIDTMIERGMRSDYIVLVGGAPLNEEFGAAVGADGLQATANNISNAEPARTG